MTCCYSLGQPHSFIRLEFQKDVPVEKFAEVYMTIHNLLEFVFFKKDIYVEHIELGSFNEEQKIYRNAEVHLLHKKDLELEKPNSVIGYYFIEDGLNELLQIFNGRKLNFLFIPENEKDDRYLDPQKYVTCCSSFESVFNFAFPNAKMMENDKMKEAKASILNFIADKDEEFKGNDGAIRKEYRSLKRIIELSDFSLADKYKWCLKKYWSYIEEFCRIVYQTMNLTEEQIKAIPERLAYKRNVLIHSNIEELEPEEIAAYQILRYIIYVIILDKCGINQNIVKNAIDCILR